MVMHYVMSIIPSVPAGVAIVAAILLAALMGVILERLEVFN
jgi:hypothetical protein